MADVSETTTAPTCETCGRPESSPMGVRRGFCSGRGGYDCLSVAYGRERAACLSAEAREQAAVADAAALRFWLDVFAGVAERAVEEHRRPKTGQQVPFHGDFAGAPPSVIGRLEWWAREFRARLASGAGAALLAAHAAAVAAKDRRIAALEALLVALRRQAETGKGPANLADLEPTVILDRFVDFAWRDGRDGERHPCFDSGDERARKLAEKSEARPGRLQSDLSARESEIAALKVRVERLTAAARAWVAADDAYGTAMELRDAGAADIAHEARIAAEDALRATLEDT